MCVVKGLYNGATGERRSALLRPVCSQVEQVVTHSHMHSMCIFLTTRIIIQYLQGGARGVARNLFWGYKSFWRWIKLLNSRSGVILPHKSLLGLIGGGINNDIHPRLYAPVYNHRFKIKKIKDL